MVTGLAGACEAAVGVEAFGICVAGVIGTFINVSTCGPIAGVTLVAFAVVSTEGIDAGGMGVAFVGPSFAFIQVIAAESVADKATVALASIGTGVVEAGSIGVAYVTVVTFIDVSAAFSVSVLIPRFRFRSPKTSMYTTGHKAEANQQYR